MISMPGIKIINSILSSHQVICPFSFCNPKMLTTSQSFNLPMVEIDKHSMISCVMSQTKTHPTRKSELINLIDQTEKSSSSTGKFGRFGGVFVPETLVSCLSMLAAEFKLVLQDSEFQGELAVALHASIFCSKADLTLQERNGRGPEIYLNREDLNHGGAHKINNALAQAMLAKRMARKSVVAATGAGQHGVATAAVCAKLALDCTIIMGKMDVGGIMVGTTRMHTQCSSIYKTKIYATSWLLCDYLNLE